MSHELSGPGRDIFPGREGGLEDERKTSKLFWKGADDTD